MTGKVAVPVKVVFENERITTMMLAGAKGSRYNKVEAASGDVLFFDETGFFIEQRSPGEPEPD